jgi:hypothetical protein
MMTKPIRIALLTLALAACGKTAGLEPQAGKSLPQKPALASRPLNADELLNLPPQAKPNRVDELNKKGDVRTVDKFDLPPPDGSAVPPTGGGEPATPSTTGPDNQEVPH